MDLLLTVLTLLAAIYAIVPRYRQLDLQLRIGLVEVLVIVITVAGALCLEFYEFLDAHFSWVPGLGCWPTGVTPKNATYVLMLVVASFLALRIRFTHLTKGRIYKFRELVEELYWAQSYGELFTLLQNHLKELFKIYESEFVISRIRNRLKPLSWPIPDLELLKIADELRASTGAGISTPKLKLRLRDRASSCLRPIASIIVRVLPEYDRAQQAAKELVRGIFLSPQFLTALARTRPYLGLEIIRESKSAFERFEFVDRYVEGLMGDSQSVLYREVRNNQNVGMNRYSIPGSNPIIHFFFSDVKVAEDNRVYKPIGDYMMSHLDELARDHTNDPYNRAAEDFHDVGSWHSPIFIGIRLFDIMVKEALFQVMRWHMWLYYMPLIVKRIVRNYRLGDPLADETDEFPLRYSLLLYEIFSCLTDWVSAVENVPAGQPNVVLKSTEPDHENDNIPKSSILALADCAYYVAVSPHIAKREKGSLLRMVFGLYFDLRSAKFDDYAAVLLKAVTNNTSYRHDHREYRQTIYAAFKEEKNEYLIKQTESRVADLESALK